MHTCSQPGSMGAVSEAEAFSGMEACQPTSENVTVREQAATSIGQVALPFTKRQSILGPRLTTAQAG